MSLDSAGLDSSGNSPRFYASGSVRNFGQGAASRFFSSFMLLNSREPIADTDGIGVSLSPTLMLSPTSFAVTQGPDLSLGASSLRPGVRYVHVLLLYYGAETGVWYYNEHVYYVNLV
jgi:hypothetical protein